MYNESLYDLYLKLFVSIVHLFVYTVFFCLVFTIYGIPIHLLRNFYLSFHTMQRRLKHFIQFRRVTESLNSRFADATEEDLESRDRICIICREEMIIDPNLDGRFNPESRTKKLPCGNWW